MSLIVDIAESVKNSLNAGTFSVDFVAKRIYVPVLSFENGEDLQVVVAPRENNRTLRNKKQQVSEVQLDVAVFKKVTDTEPETIDPLTDFVEELVKYLELKPQDGHSWIQTTNDLIYDQNFLRERKIFRSRILNSYREEAT